MAPAGPSLTWRTEFTHPEDLPGGTTTYKSSRSPRGGNSCRISSLGKKTPFKTLFYFWLQWKAGHRPLGITGVQRVQALSKSKCPSFAALPWPQHQHTQHLFLPLNHFTSFFSYPYCKGSPPPSPPQPPCWLLGAKGGDKPQSITPRCTKGQILLGRAWGRRIL